MDETVLGKINNLYNKKSFLDKYGLDIWVTVITCLIFFVITCYFYIMNNIKPIKADWENQKCSPSIMPFAGLINKGPNESVFESTGKNFTGCVQSILTNIIAYAFQPIYYIMQNLTKSFSDLFNSLNATRSMFDKMRNSVKDFSTETMGRTLNITMPITQLLMSIKSMGANMVGTLTSSLYTLFGSYLTMKSLFLLIMQFIITILFILVGLIIGFLIISFIPLFGSWAIPVAAFHIAIMIAILVPVIIVQIFMAQILELSSDSPPSVPSCFSDKNMLDVIVRDNEYIKKSIASIDVGDILTNGETVTAIMKFTSQGQRLYDINGIRVTSEHRIYHDVLGWIKVKEHPDSKLIPLFDEEFVYCISTDAKTFTIENNLGESVLFSDWDDIDDHVINSLNEFYVDIFREKSKKKYIDLQEIHPYFDNGIIGSSLIELKDGTSVQIKDVQINDLLSCANEVFTKVLGIIKINAADLNQMHKYEYANKKVYGCNVNVYLGETKTSICETSICETSICETTTSICETTTSICETTTSICETSICETSICETSVTKSTLTMPISEDKYLYQLLTDTGRFKANGITIHDYNYGIDKYIYY
jgi:hypothetical protein